MRIYVPDGFEPDDEYLRLRIRNAQNSAQSRLIKYAKNGQRTSRNVKVTLAPVPLGMRSEPEGIE